MLIIEFGNEYRAMLEIIKNTYFDKSVTQEYRKSVIVLVLGVVLMESNFALHEIVGDERRGP